jgi:hypothetical protein
MVFLRRLRRGDSVYLYRVRTYRDKATGKVKQDSEYLGKEVIRGGERVIIPPRRKRLAGVRRILDYGGVMALYQVAMEFGLPRIIDDSVGGFTRIQRPGLKATVLAINCVVAGSAVNGLGSWYLRTALSGRLGLTPGDFTPKKVRGLLGFLSRGVPDVVGMIEEGIAEEIKRYEDLSVVVYDLTPITFYGEGKGNSLARYGHAYRRTGEKQVNMVLAVTMKHRLPVHHRVLPGNIVSVSSLEGFLRELRSFGARRLLLVLDRGFYSERNIGEVLSSKYDVVGALPGRLKLTQRMLSKSTGIENSRRRLRYQGEVLFAREFRQDDLRIIVYHSPMRKAREMKVFYQGLGEVEEKLEELGAVRFPGKAVMREELEGVCGDYLQYFSFDFDFEFSRGWGFRYRLKHKAVQRRMNRLGKTVLFTSTDLPREKVLELYREKDVVDKVFGVMKAHGLRPLRTSRVDTTRARVFIAYLGYLLLSLLRMKLGREISLGKALAELEMVREVVYRDGSRALPELTKDQKAIFKKLEML